MTLSDPFHIKIAISAQIRDLWSKNIQITQKWPTWPKNDINILNMWTLYHKILHENKIFQKNVFWGREWSKSKKVALFSKKREKHDFRNKNAQKIYEIILSATNTFLRQNSLVYAQKSSLKWPILTNLLCFGAFLWTNGHFVKIYRNKHLDEKL